MNAAIPSVPERIPQLRQKLFRAMNIIEACRMGSDSMLATMLGTDDPDFGEALAAAYELINEVAGKLGALTPPGAGERP